MEFLDRTRELARLEALVARRAAGLVALWGRRRVGKTRLLNEWCRRHDGVYTVADQSAEPVQRRYFAEAMSLKLPGFDDVEYRDWASLLRRLASDAKAVDWHGPLVVDEFPYLVAVAPALPSVLQNWIDQEAATGGLLVAIAGSSQRMMQGLVLDAAAPLYGRAVEAFSLAPLPAGWIGDALKLADPKDQVLSYAAWGGIPRYWELASPFGGALDAAVDTLVLDPLGPLHDEPARLLLEESPSALSLRPLLDVIGNGSHRLSEIAGRLGWPATSLSRPLSRLQALGLVCRDVPFGESEKATRRALYRISDPFFRFWFRVIAPHRALLAGATSDVRLGLWAQAKNALAAQAWEELCRAAAPQCARMCLGDTGTNSGTGSNLKVCPSAPGGDTDDAWLPARRWWHGTAPEWDVILCQTDRRHSVAGEVKWSERPFDDDELAALAGALLARPLPPGVPGQVTRLLFVPETRSATTVTRHGVQVVTAATVLACLR